MRSGKLIKKVDNQIYFMIFVSLLWSKEILLSYIRGLLLNLPVLASVADYIIPAVIILMFLLSYSTITERLKGTDFVFAVACLVVYVGEFFFYKANREYFRSLSLDFVVGCLPFYFVGVALRGDREETILNWLYRISMVTIVVFSFYMFFIHQMSDLTVRGGDMDSAYNLLPHACLVFYRLTEKPGWGKGLVSLLSVLVMLLLGTRGAVLCLFVFMLVSLIMNVRIHNPLLFLCISVIVLLMVIFPAILDAIISGAYNLSVNMGMSTRVFDKIMNGDFATSSARNTLRTIVEYHLNKSAIVGLGLYGDRVVTGGQYVHNIFYEIWANFGYLTGTILLVSLAVFLLRGVFYVLKNKNGSSRITALLLLGYCFKLVFSGSYLTESFFWLLIGYYAALIREKRTIEYTVLRGKRRTLLLDARQRSRHGKYEA